MVCYNPSWLWHGLYPGLRVYRGKPFFLYLFFFFLLANIPSSHCPTSLKNYLAPIPVFLAFVNSSPHHVLQFSVFLNLPISHCTHTILARTLCLVSVLRELPAVTSRKRIEKRDRALGGAVLIGPSEDVSRISCCAISRDLYPCPPCYTPNWPRIYQPLLTSLCIMFLPALPASLGCEYVT